MNQTRTFFIFAWLMLAALLWMEWNKEHAPKPLPTVVPTAQPTSSVPGMPAASVATPVTAQPAAQPQMAAVATQTPVTLRNDVLSLVIDGGSVRRADLLKYRVSRDSNAAPVRLFDDSVDGFYEAQSGWVGAQGGPTHERGFVPETPATDVALADGAKDVSVAFVWHGANGVTIRRMFTLSRGDYALKIHDDVVNAGTAPWQGTIYRQLNRVPPQINTSITSPQRFGFNGAAWRTNEEKYAKRRYDKFRSGDQIDPISNGASVTGGWIALQQHYFVSGWIPQADQVSQFELDTAGSQYIIRSKGPTLAVPPGTHVGTDARLWIGPKLQEQLAAQGQGFERVLDYGILTFISEPMHWLLTHLHKFTGNWGFAIMLLVLIVKLALFPLSAAQYKSSAKMRKFQPRMQQLKERYGDDQQKYQMALMELYKKEKINPAAGCLPVLIQMPVFFALYWVLIESVELRQAPWVLWIHDLTSADPFYILPVINVAVTWFTQRLTPMVGVDPIQQRMFQLMPLFFGVLFAFMPAGLVLYWVTNGSLGLIQQLLMMRRYADKPSESTTKR